MSDLYEKTEKHYLPEISILLKLRERKLISEEELIKCILKSLSEISWKKSMKWSDHEMSWGRPLRSILAIFNEKVLKFNYKHLEALEFYSYRGRLSINQKKIKNFSEYKKINFKKFFNKTPTRS